MRCNQTGLAPQQPVSPDDALWFPEHWPPALQALAGPAAYWPLRDDDVHWLVAQAPAWRSTLGLQRRPQVPDPLLDALPALLKRTGAPVFARISPCSFKQGRLLPAPLADADALLRQLQHPGMRAAGMAWQCLRRGVPIQLCLRPWRPMRPWDEFRLFVQRGRLTAISQHHPGALHPLAPDDAGAGSVPPPDPHCRQPAILDTVATVRLANLRAALLDLAYRLLADGHLPQYVADVGVTGNPPQAVLLELNPWGPQTDAGLYHWQHDPPWDGAWRLRGAAGVVRLPLVASN